MDPTHTKYYQIVAYQILSNNSVCLSYNFCHISSSIDEGFFDFPSISNCRSFKVNISSLFYLHVVKSSPVSFSIFIICSIAVTCKWILHTPNVQQNFSLIPVDRIKTIVNNRSKIKFYRSNAKVYRSVMNRFEA